MLPVLLAEQQPIRSHQGQQPADDGGHPIEVTGPGAATELPLQRGRHLDPGGVLIAMGIDHGQSRREQGISPGGGGQLPIPFEIPWIALEILGGSELQRVDEDTQQHPRPNAGPALGGPLQQLLMALMQGAHRRHEVQGPGGLLTAPVVQLTGAAQHLHGHHDKRPTRQIG